MRNIESRVEGHDEDHCDLPGSASGEDDIGAGMAAERVWTAGCSSAMSSTTGSRAGDGTGEPGLP
jgi:hypothetical protein